MLDMICDQINSEVGSNATADKLCEYAEELAALQPYPSEIGCFELAEYKVDVLLLLTDSAIKPILLT